MKIRDKNLVLKEMIEKLYARGTEYPVWKAVAKALNRPRRKKYEVNVYKIEKFAKNNENILVPGSVLGSGEITKPVKVAALKFSKGAKEKIEKAGGKCLTIPELFKQNPKGTGVKIMG